MAAPPVITSTVTSTSTIASAVRLNASNAAFRYTGPPTLAWASVPDALVPHTAAGIADTSAFTSWEFYSNASQIEFIGTQFSSSFNIWVDGQLIQDAGIAYGAAGTRILHKLDWTADAQPTKNRLYRLAGINVIWAGVYTSAGATNSYPTELDAKPLLVAFGDSFTQGTGANGSDRVYAMTLAGCLGMNYWGEGVGSTGWASSSAPARRVDNRLSRNARQPAIIVTALGYNDIGSSSSVIASAAGTTMSRLREIAPAAQIFMLGPWDKNAPAAAQAGYTATADAMKYAIPNGKGITFVPMEGVDFTKIGDAIHPDQPGHVTLGQDIALLIKNALGA